MPVSLSHQAIEVLCVNAQVCSEFAVKFVLTGRLNALFLKTQIFHRRNGYGYASNLFARQSPMITGSQLFLWILENFPEWVRHHLTESVDNFHIPTRSGKPGALVSASWPMVQKSSCLIRISVAGSAVIAPGL